MENETLLRLSVFFGLFAALSVAERLIPRRQELPRGQRWFTNLGLMATYVVSLRLVAIVVPFLAVMAAIDADRLGIGLLNVTSWPLWIEFIIALLVLDFSIWLQHWITHKVPLLWRLHRVHHADTELDVTTALRFHPVEILFSMGLKIGLVYGLGASAVVVIIFETLLNGAAMFNHANLRLGRWDRVLQRVIVTPDMHRIHHSIHRDEHDSNYGFSTSLWDHLFGTYRDTTRQGLDDMALGVKPTGKPASLWWLLTFPFQRR